jgi:hypothetical protein
VEDRRHRVLEHLRLDERVLDETDEARGMFSNGLGPVARAAANTRRWRAIASRKRSAAPQNRAKTSG